MARTLTLWHHNVVSKSHPLIFASLVMMTCTSLAQDATPNPQLSGGPLKLDEVVKVTLVNSSAIRSRSLSKGLAQSSLQVRRGTFNVNTFATLNNGQNRPMGGSDVDEQGLTVGASKLFRSGVYSNLSISLGRYEYLPPTEFVMPMEPQNSSTVTFGITVPLLKGRGAASAAADEMAAQLTYEAEVQTYYNTISQILSNIIIVYWDYKAAMETLKVLQGSKQRLLGWINDARKGVDTTGTRLAIDDKSSPQLTHLNAYLWDQERKISDLSSQINQIKVALAVAMGIPSDQAKNICEPTEVFPTNWSDIVKRFNQGQAWQKWMANALEKRFDLRATKSNEQAAATRLAKARQNLLPQLNLGLSTGHAGYENGGGFSKYTAPLTASDESRGTNLAITLNFNYPLENDAAQGSLGIATASHQQSLLDLNELTRNVNIEVTTSIETLINDLQSVEQAQRAVQGYQPALDKYKSDQYSLVSEPTIIFNLMDLEKDLVDAMISYIQSLLALAKTVITLRYQTGALIEVNPSTNEVTLRNITSLPEL